MLYKHWKKIALTLAAMFWTSCDDTSSSAEEVPQVSPSLYGIEVPCDTESCMVIPESSEANDAQSSSSDIDESSSSFEVPVPTYGGMAVYCYNDTAVNDSGKVFDIIECNDGQKYLRFQNLYMDLPEKQKELPEGVHPVPPNPQSGIASNCTREPDICIDAFTIDENGNEQPIGGCYPSIDCPEKPQN